MALVKRRLVPLSEKDTRIRVKTDVKEGQVVFEGFKGGNNKVKTSHRYGRIYVDKIYPKDKFMGIMRLQE